MKKTIVVVAVDAEEGHPLHKFQEVVWNDFDTAAGIDAGRDRADYLLTFPDVKSVKIDYRMANRNSPWKSVGTVYPRVDPFKETGVVVAGYWHDTSGDD